MKGFGRIFGGFILKVQGASEWLSSSVIFEQGSGMTLTQDLINRKIIFSSTGGGGGGIQKGPVLPPANVSNRGVIFLLEGAPSFPDLLYVCSKDYLDAYNWNEIPLIVP